MRRFLRTTLALALLSASIAGCSRVPTAPGTPAVDVTGTWAGSASDNTGFGEFLWQVTQSGGTFTGRIEITDRSAGITGQGSVHGSVLDGTLQFTITIPSGGFDAPFDNCTTTVSGDATVASTSLSGTYAGSSSCSGKVYAGQFVLRRL